MKKIILVCISIVFTSNTFSQYAYITDFKYVNKIWKVNIF